MFDPVEESFEGVENAADQPTELFGVFQSLGDGLLRLDANGGAIRDANPSACRMLGYPSAVLREMRAEDLEGRVAAADRRVFRHRMAKAAQGKPQLFEWAVLTQAGETNWLEVSLSRDAGDAACLWASLRDVSAHKRIETATSHRLALDAALAEASRLMIAPVGADMEKVLEVLGRAIGVQRAGLFQFQTSGTFINNTHEWCDTPEHSSIARRREMDLAPYQWILKLQEEQNAIAIHDVGDLPPEARAERQTMLERGIRSLLLVFIQSSRGEMIGGMIFEALDAPRRWLPEEIQVLSVAADMIGIYLERQQMEIALWESQRKLLTLLSNLPGMAYRCRNDRQWTMEFISSGAVELTGYHPADLIENEAVAYGDLIHPEDQDPVWDDVQAALADKRPFKLTYRLRDAEGVEKWVWEQGRGIFGSDGALEALEGLVIDITDRKKAELERLELENRIQHAQKLESLGVLAGGIAHDFNNLLMGIIGNTGLALMSLSQISPARERVEHIEKAAMHLADLTNQMLAYSGKGKFVIQTISLNHLVEEMGHLLDTVISKKALLKYNLHPDLPMIDVDASQIRQVVMNLITNASDAIGEKSGVISVCSGVMEVDREYLATTYLDEALAEGIYAYIEVTDTGIGMSAETIARIFDPFFTTKFTGRGLGLAAVLGIVRGHKGAIKVYSELNRGTTFKVLFPISRHVEQPAPSATYSIDHWRGTGTILVVDDEESVRIVTEDVLTHFGFDVLTAVNGLEGLKVFAEHRASIVAVLLDLTMPKMDGEECFRELRRIQPDVRVILTSGYSEIEATDRFAGKGIAGFIQKPYRPRELVAKFKEMLEKAAPGSE